jgi:hypothetical protein
VPAKIVFDGERWGAEIAGRPAGPPNADPAVAGNVIRIWTSGHRITAEEYAYLLDVARHAAGNPDHPSSDPYRPIEVGRLPAIF